MKSEETPPKPVIGESASKLGIRLKDLAPNADGNAQPGSGGLSVVSSMAGLRTRVAKNLLPPDMVPRRLADRVPGAIGHQSLHLFGIGEGNFLLGPITDKLNLVPDQEAHGTIQPTVVMPYDAYKNAIVATRNQWASGEDDHDR